MAPDRKDMLYSSEKVTPFPAKQYNAAREREKNTVGKRLSEIRRKKAILYRSSRIFLPDTA